MPKVPAQNARGLKKAPEAPTVDATLPNARLLVEAIQKNDPRVALPLFFPQDAFRLVKAIAKPDRYHKRLVKVYLEDIATMRRSLKAPDTIEFVSFKLGRQKRWMATGKEGNALPYHAVYQSKLEIRDAGKTKVLKLRVMINWGDTWHVTHLTRK